MSPEEGVVNQRPAVHGFYAGNVFEVSQRCLGQPYTGLAGALVSKQVFRTGPTLIIFPHQVLHRHRDVFEKHLVDLMFPIKADHRANGNAWGVHIY